MINKIAIHSVPRSGSTWLGSIFDSCPDVLYRYQPLFSYGHKSQLNPKSSKQDIESFFDSIKNTEDKFVLQEEAKVKGIVPIFNKNNPSHIVYKEVRYHNILKNLLNMDSTIKVVGIIRSPFAVLNSWMKAPKEFKKELGWKIEEEWCFAPKKNLNKPEEFNGYNKWKEAGFLFLEFKKKYPKQFYLLNYNDLLFNTVDEIKCLFEFCSINYTEQTEIFINQSKSSQSNDAYAVYKQKKDDLAWINSLPTYIEQAIKNDKEFKMLNNLFKWI